ncbi:MAG: class I SAM-dependent methyltransferase [Chloroflexota bacterium]|nr:class I SAM-dependent methyltransferase [Chloroflexota bacterium]
MFRVITIDMLIIISLIFFILIFCIALLWILIPALYGLPSVPTRPDRIRKALKLVNLRPDEVLYDLGAGDGRVLIIAAREFGALPTGIEVGPVQCALIWLRVVASGLGDKIQIQWKNFFRADLQAADVVYVYATSQEVLKLAPFLQKQMKAGSRLVSISADFPEWEPSTFDERDLIFVYEMPPKPGSIMSYLLEKANE